MVRSDTLKLETKGFGDTIDITDKVREILIKSGIKNGLITVFCPGSTGTITTIEYESGVIRDLKNALERLVPSDIPYEHDYKWHDGNGFSHVRAAMMKPSLTIPFIEGELTLGTWQQVVFIDFDNRSRRRNIVVHIIGE
ncbi:MAG TPA: secondary thiamine-phosphate synthase enzyme YjbQ [Syntrophorhabdaceae bacterium]|nr:secondary thiamine-phosphate synthase enzyme YjbQ [Syntrophorhabdaceae bacterium]